MIVCSCRALNELQVRNMTLEDFTLKTESLYNCEVSESDVEELINMYNEIMAGWERVDYWDTRVK